MSLAASRPLLILLTWRTEDTPEWLARLDVRRIWLRSLDVASANALLAICLGTAPDLDALKAHILRHTGQVPLFIEEVARQLLNRGVIDGDASRFAAKAPWDALGIPPTVQGVIASRIDRLSKEDKSLLQLASVVGPRISPALAGGRDRHAGRAIAKPPLVAGDSGFPRRDAMARRRRIRVCPRSHPRGRL